MALIKLKKQNFLGFYFGWKVEVVKRPHYGEKVFIHTWARDTGSLITYRDFEIYDGSNTLCAKATSKWVLIDMTKGRMTKIDSSILEAYHPEEKSVFTNPEIDKLSEPQEHESTFSYTVQRGNIDINQHMHNLYYLDLAYEALPEEIYAKEECNDIEIMYKKEVKFGSTLNCYYHYDASEKKHIVTIKSEDDKYLHAIISLS